MRASRTCDLGAAIAAAVQRARPVLERHLVLVVVPENIAVVADEAALTRVLEDLLGDAAKHAPPDTTVRVITERIRSAIVVSVEGGRRFCVSLRSVPVAPMRRPVPAGFLHSAS